MDVLCDVCRQRAATGGNIRTIDGKEVTTNYCDECRPRVPLGHTAWATATAHSYPWVRFVPQLVAVSVLIIVAIVLIRWLGR
jgi:hypothetical protein